MVGLLITALAAALGAATYFTGEVPSRWLWPAIAGRTVAWGTTALLVLNPAWTCYHPPQTPIVLLDTSLSLSAAGGQAAAARQLADSLGEVRPFGGSRLHEPLAGVAASERPVVVVTDGELHDVADLPPHLLDRTTVHLLPREPQPDLALVAVSVRRWIAATDTLRVWAELEGSDNFSPTPVTLEVRANDRVIGRLPDLPAGPGRTEATIVVLPGELTAGEQVLDLVLTGHEDVEPRTDRRQALVTVTPTPGIVLVAGVPGWESRFLFQTVGAVAGLPIRGFVQVESGRWRDMTELTPVPSAAVAAAVRSADLLITMGGEVPDAGRSRARGRWDWSPASPVAGDWFLTPAGESPVAGILATIPTDSLPPATALAPMTSGVGSWLGFTAQLSRRGAVQPALVGRVEGGRRRVEVGAWGFWRWAFRGGIAEQAYRGWVAETITWLLAGSDSSAGLIRPIRPVVEQDEPVVFEWMDSGTAVPVPVVWTGGQSSRSDTLVFDGAGQARVALPVGIWRYRAGSDSGVVVVEEYSSEFLPRPVTVESRNGQVVARGRPRGAREWPWLFAIPVLAWCLEWWTRRRGGLR